MFSPLLHGWRSWKSARAVGLLAVAALAIGIGSTTAIYTVVHAVMLKPLPYADPERYFIVFGAWRPHPKEWTVFSYQDYLDYVPQIRTLDVFGVFAPGNFNVIVDRELTHVVGTEASAGLMRSLGVPLAMGRWFEDREKQKNGLPGAVISTSLWRRSGSNRNIVGKGITLNGEQFTITGVAPSWFRFPVDEPHNDIWIPLSGRGNRTDHYLRAIAKLKPGVTRQQATEDLNRIQIALQKQYSQGDEPDFVYLRPLLDFVLEGIRPSLLLLLGAAVALLLITCANVASLLLARAVARARETATRVALGATGWQLGLQYFYEGLLVSCAGAAAGTLLSVALVRAVLSIAAEEIPRADRIAFNAPIFSFTLAVAICCAVFFSLFPLWQAHRTPPNAVLSQGIRASAGSASRKLLRIFVVAEVALAFVLLAVGGMAYEHLTELRYVQPGFDAANLLVMNVFAPFAKYHTDEALMQYEAALGDSIRHVPGVENAGFTSVMPIADWGNNTWLFVEGRPKPRAGEQLSVEHRWVSPEYFETMKIPLLKGRFFTDTDRRGTVNALLINQTLANLYWPHQDPIGAYVTLFGFPPDRKFQVIGVVGDVRNGRGGLNAPTLPEVYIPFREFATGHMSWAVRTSTDPMKLVPQLRRAVLSVDPTQPPFDIRTMSTVIQTSLVNQRLESLMVGFFAIAALLLANLGVYGVVAYALRQRLTEMGTRMALGAEPRELLRLVLREGFKMAAIGIGIGLAIVLVILQTFNTRALHTDVHAVTPLLVSALLITVCTLLASWVPAWRASTLSPMVAIRNDLHPSMARLRIGYRELTGRVSALLSEEPHPLLAGTELLAALADASRNAESFAEAIQIALKTIRDEVRASGATLLTRRAPDQPYRCAATTLEGQIEAALPLDALLLRRLRSYSSALPFSPADLAALRQWAAEHAPENLPEIETLVTLDAALAVPVLSKTQMVGVLLLGSPVDRAEYSSVERRVLRSAAAQIALMLDNARLTDRIVQQERLTRDLELAGEVQKRLFPEKSPESAAVQLIGISIPARGVGGDYYDFLELGNKQIGVALADVAGKGIPAALGHVGRAGFFAQPGGSEWILLSPTRNQHEPAATSLYWRKQLCHFLLCPIR